MLLAVTVECQAQFRIVPQGLVVVLDCALVLAFAHEHGAAVVEGLRAVRSSSAASLAAASARPSLPIERVGSIELYGKGSHRAMVQPIGNLETV
jgi:hypothetical protein